MVQKQTRKHFDCPEFLAKKLALKARILNCTESNVIKMALYNDLKEISDDRMEN